MLLSIHEIATVVAGRVLTTMDNGGKEKVSDLILSFLDEFKDEFKSNCEGTADVHREECIYQINRIIIVEDLSEKITREVLVESENTGISPKKLLPIHLQKDELNDEIIKADCLKEIYRKIAGTILHEILECISSKKLPLVKAVKLALGRYGMFSGYLFRQYKDRAIDILQQHKASV